MRILIVGGNKSWWAIERYYIDHLRELGVDVHVYAAPDIVFDYHSKNIFNKVLFKTKIKTGYKKVNTELMRKALSIKPDIIWVFKGMEIYPSTLVRLKTQFKLANYNPDHPFIISGSGSGNSYVTDSVGLYHLHFCYNSILQKQIEQEYRIPAVFLPFGYELKWEDYLVAAREPELEKICFIGNPDKIREDTISHLAENGFAIDVYGHGWDKTILRNRKGVDIHAAIDGMEFWYKIRGYRVQLNIFRKHNLGSHNMRSFEIPAGGGIQLAPYSPEHASFFEEGKEIFLYRNQDELLKLAKRLLENSKEQAEAIRQAAVKRSLESGYTYKDRALTVFKTFERMLINEQG